MAKGAGTDREVIRVSGKLKEILTIRDEKGNVLHKMMQPLMVEFYPRDLMQVIVGSTILAIPVAFTEETWKLGESLPFWNVLVFGIVSLIFIASFVYYNFYRKNVSKHWKDFLKRVFSVYIVSFLVVTMLLLIIQRAPWTTDWVLALKRTIIVSFPASMSAAVADMIK